MGLTNNTKCKICGGRAFVFSAWIEDVQAGALDESYYNFNKCTKCSEITLGVKC